MLIQKELDGFLELEALWNLEADADPDSAYHFDAEPDPDPTFHYDPDPDTTFNLLRNRIRILPLTFSQIWTLQCYKMTL